MNQKKNIVLGGYDVVSYFEQGDEKNLMPLEGNKKFIYEYQGFKYYFSSKKNKQKFIKDPQNYPVAYGGWCAYAMAKGEKVRIDPETYKIIDNKLYLFYNSFGINTLKKWNKKEIDYKLKADLSWKNLVSRK